MILLSENKLYYSGYMELPYKYGLKNIRGYTLSCIVGLGLSFLLLVPGCGETKYRERHVEKGRSFIHDGYSGKNFIVTYQGGNLFLVDPTISDRYTVALDEGECLGHSGGKTNTRVKKIEHDSVTLVSPVSGKDCRVVHILQ